MPEARVAIGVLGALVAALAAFALLTGVGRAGAEASGTGDARTTPTATPTPTPAPAPAQAVPDVPVSSTSLDTLAPAPAPTRFTAPDLGIDVSVQPVGLDEQGRMDLIDDPAIAAWYKFGSSPADPTGSTVIAAHVDSLTYNVLPFARLKDAAAGSIVSVTTADGVVHSYAIESVTVSEKTQIDWTGAFDRLGDRRLTLVTCGGEFDYETRTYSSNVIVTAVPVA